MRRNYTVHLALAAALVLLAAFVGQVRRWEWKGHFDGPLASSSRRTRFVSSDTVGGPNDPLLTEQRGLINTGQREGKAQADISALAAWSKTHGSERVVVAVLDSGVDYTHPDLMNNIW